MNLIKEVTRRYYESATSFICYILSGSTFIFFIHNLDLRPRIFRHSTKNERHSAHTVLIGDVNSFWSVLYHFCNNRLKKITF